MSDEITGLFKKGGELFGIGGGKKKRKAPEVPTIDQAREAQIESDRIRRRRGNLGNIFGGALNSTPAVAGARLLGG